MPALGKGLAWWSQWHGPLGTLSALRWLCLRLGIKAGILDPESWRVRPARVRHNLEVRLRGSSDINVFYQIFVVEEYAVLRELTGVATVLDLGANVGYSSAYFLSCFPSARVLAVEPDDSNFRLCRSNLAPYNDRVQVVHGAVWAERKRLSLSRSQFGDGREWATQVSEGDDEGHGDVQAFDMNSLIELAGGGPVDLLKIDIERSELAVFGSPLAQTWLPKVRNICIELHGKDCEDALFSALAGYDYELSHSDELTICRNLRVRK